MRPLTEFENWRIAPPSFWKELGGGGPGDPLIGCFLMQHRGTKLKTIVTCGDGWEHISVSTPKRCPTWEEMDWIASRFFQPDETAMQLHVPADDHVNYHPHCLHWWRPIGVEIPRPPFWMVGPKRQNHAA